MGIKNIKKHISFDRIIIILILIVLSFNFLEIEGIEEFAPFP